MDKRGSVVILLVVLFVALSILGIILFKSGYFGESQVADLTNIPSQTAAIDTETQNITKVESGDEVSDIDKDLTNTNFNSLDQEVTGIKSDSDSL